MTSFLKFIVSFTVLSILKLCSSQDATSQPTVSPDSEFIASPSNTTVLEGHPAVLKCKIRDTVHNCQWFYIENGLDIFDPKVTPTLVMEFRSIKDQDCSIRFSKTKKAQEGQWLCKGLQIHARKYVVSRPVTLQVIAAATDPENTKGQQPTESDNKNPSHGSPSKELTFETSEDGYIINTKLGDQSALPCNVNQRIDSCAWIRPDGTKLRIAEDVQGQYTIKEDLNSGNCSLVLKSVSSSDEGNWRCVASIKERGDRLGPLIHLHVMEHGSHPNFPPDKFTEEDNNTSLVAILVTTSLVLLSVIICLIFYMYRRVWRKDNNNHTYLNSSRGDVSEYSSYGSNWLPGVGMKDPKLIENAEVKPEDQNSNHYTRYLDMTGNSSTPEGYVMFPATSLRSSMSSRATLSTVANVRSSSADSEHGRVPYNNEGYQPEAMFGNTFKDGRVRPSSLYSTGHLYEEIDESKVSTNMPEYANIDEDDEGYMIPKRVTKEKSTEKSKTQDEDQQQLSEEEEEEGKEGSIHSQEDSEKITKAPPYSKVGEIGLVPAGNERKWIANPTYSLNQQTVDQLESYDVPIDPPLPIRTDSAYTPLASYDVPKKSTMV